MLKEEDSKVRRRQTKTREGMSEYMDHLFS